MAKRRCLKRVGASKGRCVKWAKRSGGKTRKGKKSCKLGVSKTTGKCLKTKRARKR